MFSVKNEKNGLQTNLLPNFGPNVPIFSPSPGVSLEEYIQVPPDGSDGNVYEIACVNLADLGGFQLQIADGCFRSTIAKVDLNILR